ncbi:hypothetical protein ACFW1A_40485, partial [Kitasatospora sp. NPDC058965]
MSSDASTPGPPAAPRRRLGLPGQHRADEWLEPVYPDEEWPEPADDGPAVALPGPAAEPSPGALAAPVPVAPEPTVPEPTVPEPTVPEP